MNACIGNGCSPGCLGWSGGAMELGKLPAPGRPTVWMTLGQGPIVLAVGRVGVWFGYFYSRQSHQFQTLI